MDRSSHIHALAAFPPQKQLPAPSDMRKSGAELIILRRAKSLALAGNQTTITRLSGP